MSLADAVSGRLRAATPPDAPRLAAIHVATWHETYAGLLPDAVIGSSDVVARTALWTEVLSGRPDPHAGVFLLGDVGFVACGTQRDARLRDAGYDGEIGALYVLRAGHGRGGGRALMRRAMQHLAGRGFRGAALWVLAANEAARGFYERLGGVHAGDREDIIHHHAMDDVAYGWPDITAFLYEQSAPERPRVARADSAARGAGG